MTEATEGRSGQIEGHTTGRLVVASFLCGPLGGLAVMLVIALASAALSPATAIAGIAGAGAVGGAVIGWPLMLVFGLPAHIVLYRRRMAKFGHYSLAGALGGFLAWSLIVVVVAFTGGLSGLKPVQTASLLLFALASSVAAASIFWLIRRPDRDKSPITAVAAVFE